VGKFPLSAAIEKVSHVRVLLGFCHPIVPHPDSGKDVRENISWQLWRKGDGQRVLLVVNSKANKMCVRPVLCREIIKARNGQRAGDLPRTIRAKVKEDDRVAILNRCDRLSVCANHYNWLNKFIVDAAFIAFLDRRDRIVRRLAFAMDEQTISAFSSLPALVSIHRVVTPDHRSDLADTDFATRGLHLRDVFVSRLGRCVAAVQKTVNVHAAHFAVFRHAQQSERVFLRRMHHAV
jgi:hypothetical protein